VPAANLSQVSPQDACEVCGRTFLVGEKVHSYVSADGRHEVCELCVDRVAALGWLPADQEGAEEALRTETERRPGFFGRMFSRPEEVEEEAVGDAPTRQIHELETERYDVEAEWRGEVADANAEEAGPSPVRRRLSDFFGPSRRRARGASEEPHGSHADIAASGASQGAAADPPVPDAPLGGHYGDRPHGHPAHLPSPDEVPEPEHSPVPPAPAPDAHASPAPLPDPAGRGMRPRRLQPDLSPATRFERAVARFNGSDAGRTAAGLTRTLGAPSVSVGDLAGDEDVVRVTVAWELTWYQWGVDLADELRPVFELERGYEVSEIDAAARQWNASAHDGRIVMVAPSRREAENGRPVHR
jgi:hypothetical protein